MSPHCHHEDRSVQYSFSSIVAQNQLIEQIPAKFPAMSKDLNGLASYVYQNPKHMPDTESQNRGQTLLGRGKIDGKLREKL